MPDPVVDQEAQREFVGRMVGIYTGAVLTKLIDLGTQTGLFEAAAAGPATCAGLAARAGLQERYVREWLGAMVAGGIFEYDPASGSYELPRERAELLSGNSSRNLAPMSQGLDHFGKHLSALAECFRSGGGLPYSVFRPEFTERMDDLWRRIYDEQLVDGFLGAAPGLRERLREGILVADIGCGTGHAANLMAREYPTSRFVGYDIGEDAIAAARVEAQVMGLDNVRFEVLDVRQLPTEPSLDLITAFDAIHDQAQPDTVLRSVRAALGDDGTFLMIEFKFSSNLEANLDNPFAALYYGISTMHCLTVSLAEGGAGLGTVWGVELARSMLEDAGFDHVDIVDSPRPQNCIFICRP
jgi:SAM-dependent methyltransferase